MDFVTAAPKTEVREVFGNVRAVSGQEEFMARQQGGDDLTREVLQLNIISSSTKHD